MPAPTKLSSSPTIADLESASKIIKDNLQADAGRVPELDVALVAAGGANTSSAAYSDTPTDAWLPFAPRKTIQLPSALNEELSVVPRRCRIGLLTEIHCAYITMNNRLYIWDYVAGNDFLRFEEQPHEIGCVALVRPKVGIFIDSIEWILVISTKATLLLLGLSREASTGEIKLYQTDMMVDVDKNEMDNIVGTKDGRVFMTGLEDGNLYELDYQVEEGWFRKKIRLNNITIGPLQNILPSMFGFKQADPIVQLTVDNERNYLYAYTYNNASLTIYSLGTQNGTQLAQLGVIPSLASAISPLLPPNPNARKFANKGNFGVSGLHVIPRAESRNICLVAVTFQGLRIYLTDGRGSAYSSSGLRVAHLRFPPPETETANLGELVASSYINGSLLCAYGSDAAPDSNPIVGATVDLGKLVKVQAGVAAAPNAGMAAPGQAMGIYNPYPAPRPPLSEYSYAFNVPGRIWTVRNLPKASSAGANTSGSIWTSAPNAPTSLNMLATQFTEPPDQFVVFTNTALTFVVRKRTTDVLRAILESDVGGPMGGPPTPGGVATFIEAYGRDETCAQLIALAAGNTFLSFEASEPQAYSLSGAGALLGTGKDGRLSNLASQAFFERGGKPVWIDRAAFAGGDAQGQVVFSGRREGLALYMARVLRPIWNEKVTVTNASGRQEPFVSDQTLFNVQRNLSLLQEFINANQHSFRYSAGELALSRPSTDQEAWKGEAASMELLEELLAQTIEAISFVLLLIDYKISDVIASCDKATQDAAGRLTYSELVTTKQGRDVARSLLNAVINQQLSYQISLDAISEILQQRCGSFCSSDDVMQYKAMENLRKAKELPTSSKERQTYMVEALRLFEKGITNMSLTALNDVVTEFRELKWPMGAIELPLRCATAWDPDGIGLEWRPPARSIHDQNASPTGTIATLKPEGAGGPSEHAVAMRQAWETRMRCYDIALGSFNSFNETEGVTTDADLTAATALRNDAWNAVFSSTDAAFHSRLYDWCMERGLTDIILNVQTPFIEEHLRKAPLSRERLQLLWQYYVKNEQYLRAADILYQLAKTTELPLGLPDRVEFLTLAVSNARSHAGSEYSRKESAVQFLTNVEEHLEVAQVQVEALTEVQALISRSGGLAAFDALVGESWGGLDRLENSLLTISEIYKEYADPLHMLRLKLLVFHVAAYHEGPLVKNTWDSIIQDVLTESSPQGAAAQASALEAEIVGLANRFYPSEAAFPLDHIVLRLETFALENRQVVPPAWTPRLLLRGNVSPGDIFNSLRSMYDAQVPPFNESKNIQSLSSEIAILLQDWIQEVVRPHSSLSRRDFPADLIDSSIDGLVAELSGENATRTADIYRQVKSLVRQYF